VPLAKKPVHVAIPAPDRLSATDPKAFEINEAAAFEHLGRGGANPGPGKLPAGPGPGGPAVEGGLAPNAAYPAFPQRRNVDDAEHRRALPGQADQGAEQRLAGDKRLGAVDGVQIPDEIGVGADLAQFLAEDAVAGRALSIMARMHCSACRSASVTGLKVRLGLDLQAAAKMVHDDRPRPRDYTFGQGNEGINAALAPIRFNGWFVGGGRRSGGHVKDLGPRFGPVAQAALATEKVDQRRPVVGFFQPGERHLGARGEFFRRFQKSVESGGRPLTAEAAKR